MGAKIVITFVQAYGSLHKIFACHICGSQYGAAMHHEVHVYRHYVEGFHFRCSALTFLVAFQESVYLTARQFRFRNRNGIKILSFGTSCSVCHVYFRAATLGKSLRQPMCRLLQFLFSVRQITCQTYHYFNHLNLSLLGQFCLDLYPRQALLLSQPGVVSPPLPEKILSAQPFEKYVPVRYA